VTALLLIRLDFYLNGHCIRIYFIVWASLYKRPINLIITQTFLSEYGASFIFVYWCMYIGRDILFCVHVSVLPLIMIYNPKDVVIIYLFHFCSIKQLAICFITCRILDNQGFRGFLPNEISILRHLHSMWVVKFLSTDCWSHYSIVI